MPLVKNLAVLLVCASLSAPLVSAGDDLSPVAQIASDDDLSPVAPLALTATDSDEGVLLSWTASPVGAAAEGFRVYRSDGGGFQVLAETTGTQFLDAEGRLGPLPAADYRYYVTAFNDAGESPPSNPIITNYPYCWTIIQSPGIFNLPVGITDDCFVPIPVGCTPFQTREPVNPPMHPVLRGFIC